MFAYIRSRWGLPTTTLAATLVLAAGVLLRVDLAPHVQADFFFAPDDPQLEESRALAARYGGSGELVIVRAESAGTGSPDSPAYLERLADLAGALEGVPGVNKVYSVASEDPASPLWSRVLTPAVGVGEGSSEEGPREDFRATNVVLQVDSGDGVGLSRGIETVLAAHEQDDFRLVTSGAVVVVELIRRGLARDLAIFSVASLLIFGAVTGLIYRNGWIVAGTMLSCVCACAATLLVTYFADVRVGLLTANIVTIVFVLALSHTVFLTAAWRRAMARAAAGAAAGADIADDGAGLASGGSGPPDSAHQGSPAVRAATQAAKRTIRPCLWCMATTAAGFMSLWLASAQPLRALGTAGAVGAVTALVCVFAILPVWLRNATVAPNRSRSVGSWLGQRTVPAQAIAIVGVIVVVAAGTGLFRLNTDPSLLSYFDPDGPIRAGLEVVDREGGSSPLLLAVQRNDGARLDNNDGYDRLWQLQDSLESDPATGIVLSPAPILAHARTFPLANLLPVSMLLGLLERPEFGGIASGFVSDDRSEVLYSIQMIEGGRQEPRQAVVARLAGHAEEAGLAVNAVAGLYELQARLGVLVGDSMKIGLTGLLCLCLLVGVAVSGSGGTALAILACLTAVPAIVLGTFGHFGLAMDIVTSPAPNVALAMGVDSTIHLVSRVRRLSRGAAQAGGPWHSARDELARPVLTAAAVICAGFGIFVLSDFPPTRRFGFAVILGTAAAAWAALAALPALLSRTTRKPQLPQPGAAHGEGASPERNSLAS